MGWYGGARVTKLPKDESYITQKCTFHLKSYGFVKKEISQCWLIFKTVFSNQLQNVMQLNRIRCNTMHSLRL